MTTSGAIAAVDSAAIDHQLMPCEPVWLATITGSVLAFGAGEQRGEEILVPAQHEREDERCHHARQRDRQHDAEERAPDRQAVDEGGLLELDRDRIELVAHDPDDDRQHHQRIEQDQADARVEQAPAPCRARGTASRARRAAGSAATGRRTRCPCCASRRTCTRSGSGHRRRGEPITIASIEAADAR